MRCGLVFFCCILFFVEAKPTHRHVHHSRSGDLIYCLRISPRRRRGSSSPLSALPVARATAAAANHQHYPPGLRRPCRPHPQTQTRAPSTLPTQPHSPSQPNQRRKPATPCSHLPPVRSVPLCVALPHQPQPRRPHVHSQASLASTSRADRHPCRCWTSSSRCSPALRSSPMQTASVQTTTASAASLAGARAVASGQAEWQERPRSARAVHLTLSPMVFWSSV